MSLNAETKAKIVADFSRGTNDTGSPIWLTREEVYD
jgi:small subunit ribosomal protein S15